MCFFSPVTAMLGYIPLVGGILRAVSTVAVMLACLLVALPVWLLFVAAAWLYYHPKVGLIVLAIGIVLLMVLIIISIKRPPQVILIPGRYMAPRFPIHNGIGRVFQ